MIGKIRVISEMEGRDDEADWRDVTAQLLRALFPEPAAADITFHEISIQRQQFWFSGVVLAADGT